MPRYAAHHHLSFVIFSRNFCCRILKYIFIRVIRVILDIFLRILTAVTLYHRPLMKHNPYLLHLSKIILVDGFRRSLAHFLPKCVKEVEKGALVVAPPEAGFLT